MMVGSAHGSNTAIIQYISVVSALFLPYFIDQGEFTTEDFLSYMKVACGPEAVYKYNINKKDEVSFLLIERYIQRPGKQFI